MKPISEELSKAIDRLEKLIDCSSLVIIGYNPRGYHSTTIRNMTPAQTVALIEWEKSRIILTDINNNEIKEETNVKNVN